VKRLLALLLACLALVGAACGDLTKPYAAKVNGQRITVDDLDRELKLILDNKRVQEVMAQGIQLMPGEEILGQGKGTLNMAVVANQLTLRVLYELVHQEVERRDITFTADEREQAEAAAARQFGDPALFRTLPERYRDEIIRNALEFGGLQTKLLDEAAPSEAEVRAFYDENPDQFTGRCVSHILVETREAIDALRAQIVAGAPFAEVARASSIDPGSGQEGGLLGCFPEGQPLEGIVEPFKSTAEALPVGQLSEPVQTQFGFHLIIVSSGRPFEDVKEQLAQQLSQQSGQERLRTLLRRLVDRARIEINPRYGRFVKAEQPFGRIVPPQAPTAGAPTTTTTAPLLFDPRG
jgi:parvulin-like peptidyl-prolyl isomerase